MGVRPCDLRMVDLTNHLISIVQPSSANTAPQPTEVSSTSTIPVVMSPEQESTLVNPTAALVLPTFSTSVPHNRSKETTHTKVIVGGLPYHTTDKTLKEHFQAYGEIDEAVVITDRSTGKSKGYGFVIMSTQEEAEQALQEPNPIIEGRKANVNLSILGAKPRGNAAPKLPLTAISPEYASLLGGQFSLAAPQALTQAPYAVPTTLQAAATAYQLASTTAPGKARSSMNLTSISGRQPVQQQAINPYLQQLYAVAAATTTTTEPTDAAVDAGGPGRLHRQPSAGHVCSSKCSSRTNDACWVPIISNISHHESINTVNTYRFNPSRSSNGLGTHGLSQCTGCWSTTGDTRALFCSY